MNNYSSVLALETSCDETAVAILAGRGTVLAEGLHSQIAEHAPFGGVVPEIASRSHLEVLPRLITAALANAEVRMRKAESNTAPAVREGIPTSDFRLPTSIDAFAATTGPGLAPALLVGVAAAQGLAAGAGKPFIGVNHIEGHLLSPFFGHDEIPPHTALVASGGHTLLFDVEGFRRYRLLGRTLDDAAGEAFDKVAKLLGLPYPGGVEIERLARNGDPAAITFPRALMDSFDFSFSGLKTSVRYFLERNASTHSLSDICASFQEAVVDALAIKLARAAKSSGHAIATIGGGVSSNARLAEKTRTLLARNGIELLIPERRLRTDNALMIAYVAALELSAGPQGDTSTAISPQFDYARFAGIGTNK